MDKGLKSAQLPANSLMTADESLKIDQKVAFELQEAQCKLIQVAGITNIIMGLFVTWVFYERIELVVLMSWYATLFLFNVLNMSVAFYYLSHKPNHLSAIKSRANVCHIIMGAIALTWGMIGIITSYFPVGTQYQLFALAFLLTVLVAFSLGTATDFIASVICINSLLLPSIIFYAYSAIQSTSPTYEINLNIAFIITFVNIGIFVLITSYVASKLIKKSFQLTFINVELSQKLENINKSLEYRVKERTVELEKSLDVVKYQATHDLLTDLANHHLLVDYIKRAIKTAKQNQHMFAIFFFGLNEMDKINDGIGHHASELTVQTIAKRLNKIFSHTNKNNILANFNYSISLSRRDEFVILLEPVVNIEMAEALEEVFFSVLEEPVYIDHQAIKLTASIGVSLYPRDGKDVKSLLMDADAAMRSAKRWGGNKLNIYKKEINADASRQLKIEMQLHNALKNNEFRLYYQPFIDLQTGRVCGMEALLRWKSPILGFVPPIEFILLAEADGIIIPLGEWVFEQACLQTKMWHELGFNTLTIAINLSAKQLQQKDIITKINTILTKTKLTPNYIEIELTETVAFKEETVPIIKKLKSMGFRLSIDDFGTGYSGLKSLKQFSIDKLKIDQSFIQDIDRSNDSKTIVFNTIALAKKMGIITLAEGVETQQQLTFLREGGCDMIQGYYFSPALPGDDFTELLLSQRCLLLEE